MYMIISRDDKKKLFFLLIYLPIYSHVVKFTAISLNFICFLYLTTNKSFFFPKYLCYYILGKTLKMVTFLTERTCLTIMALFEWVSVLTVQPRGFIRYQISWLPAFIALKGLPS